MLLAILPDRGTDDYGSGEYGASRGNRTHNGVDFAVAEGTTILAPATGKVTKIGYVYSDDMSYLYVQITDGIGAHHRIFYVDPEVKLGDQVFGQVSRIGSAQNISNRYTERGVMKNHVHYEIKFNGEFVEPKVSNNQFSNSKR